MKKLLLVAFLLVASQAAFATKARLLALGESKDDSSYYFMDDRRIFLNPAFLNQAQDMVVTEWGNTGNALGLDTDDAPKAEAGFYKNAGSMAYGLHFGQENDTASMLQTVAGISAANKTDNVINAFVSGKGDMEWGAGFLYSSNKNESTGTSKFEQDAMALRLGAIMGDAEAYVVAGLKNTVDVPNAATPVKFDGSLAIQAGGSYKMGMGTAFATYKTATWDQFATSVKSEGKYNEIIAGYGIIHDRGEGGKTYCRAELIQTAIELKAPTVKSEIKQTIVPVVIGYEKEATSWLILRGSVTHNLYGVSEGTDVASLNASAQAVATSKYGTTGVAGKRKVTRANSTDVAAGATLTFGKLYVDGTLSSLSATDTQSETGVLKLDNMMTRVALRYTF